MNRINDKLSVVLQQRNPMGIPTTPLRVTQNDFTEKQSKELKKLIGDIEGLISESFGENKEQWPATTLSKFSEIRHKLLDRANTIERLPSCMYYDNVPVMSVNSGEAIASLLNNITK